jgi:uncharacterized protein (UPF0335 family)
MGRRKQLDIESNAPEIGANGNVPGQHKTQLKGFVLSIEGLKAQIREATEPLRTEMKSVYEAARDAGFNRAAINAVIVRRAMSEKTRTMADAYEHVFFSETPLGQAASLTREPDVDAAAATA